MNQWNNKSMKPLMKLSTMQRPRIEYQEFLRKEIHKFMLSNCCQKGSITLETCLMNICV